MPTNELSFSVLSDIHYYSDTTGTEGKAYERAKGKSQKLLGGSEAVLRDCFDRVASEENEIVLISGDLTNNGENAAHEGVIRLLRELKSRGKRVYAITATHDYQGDGFTWGYEGDSETKVPARKREELFELYRQFGPDEAISIHRESMSYVVQLAEGFRLFALNDDSNLQGKSGFSEDCFTWISEQAQQAREQGQFIIAMTHHPIISPSPFYSIIGAGDMMGDWSIRRQQLSDMGIGFLITGHTHIQSITAITSDRGSPFYDISVASPIGFPGTYRKLVCNRESRTVEVKTCQFSKESTLSVNGVQLYDALKKQLCGMVEEVLDAAATDAKKFAYMATAFSIPESKGVPLGRLIKPVAKWLKKLTIGRVAKKVSRRTGLSPGDYAHIADERVIDFIVSLILHLFEGDAPYTPDTAHYKITVAVLDAVDSLLKRLHVSIGKLLKGTESVRSLVEPLLYKDGLCDSEAVLKL